MVFASTTNKLGKVEKNAKVKAGPCIFPFKYKHVQHTACIPSDKGDICATEVNEKTNTLTKYGYCENSVEKGTKKKTLSRSPSKGSRKLKSIRTSQPKSKTPTKSKSKTPTKSKSKSKSKSPRKVATPKKRTMKRVLKRRPLKVVSDLKQQVESPKEPVVKPTMKVYNEEFIDVLGQLATIMQKQGEPFRARAYQKAQETIMTFPTEITNAQQLAGLPAIGKTILSKLEEYEKTGTLAVLEREKNNPVNVLTNIYGVGPKKAQQLISDGYTTIEQLTSLADAELKKIFNKNQLMGLQYYSDINQKIPRSEIVEFDKLFEKTMKKCCDSAKSRFEIVGSYRRGKLESGDIDVIITNSDDDKSVFDKFIDALQSEKVLEYSFSKGPTKSLTMCRLSPTSKVARRVDFLYTSPSEYPFAILYFTGSKIFNTVMRQRALSMGYTLNEHGISHMKAGVKGQKVDHDFKTEKDIFDFLGMKYKKPEERIDGRAVETKSSSASKDEEPAIVGEVEPSVEPVANQVEEPSNTKVKLVKVKRAVPKKTMKKEPTLSDHLTHADKFKRHGISYIETLTEKEVVDLILQANDAYYNKAAFLTDDEFDIIKEFGERKFPDNAVFKMIGAPVEKGKVKLPYNMPSMNKIKPDSDALSKWKAKYKGPYVLSAKLDGVSGMFVLEKGKKAKLYTRGDGSYGQDVSHIIPYLRLPNLGTLDKLVIRGEFIIKKALFASKYGKEFSNPRNFVAGVINSKSKVPSKYKDLDFVSYELIHPIVKPSEQFDMLLKLDIDVVWNESVKDETKLTNELLSNRLVELRDTYEYEIDGVIVCDDKVYDRTQDNPEHSFAFKMVLSDQVAEVKVLDVLWSPSKDGYLKPRVQVEPVVLGGAKIEYATGFNAKFIEDNKIGVGAVIELVRSGDVIPHILKVVKPAATAMMPDVPWKWNATHVDAVLENKSADETVLTKTVTLFFKHLDTVGMGPGNVRKLIEAGFNGIPAIIHATVPELQSVLGKKTGQNVFDNMKAAIEKASVAELMTATNIFGRGFGDKRFVGIMEAVPNVLTGQFDKDELVKQVTAVKGMSKTSAVEFVAKLPEFKTFMEEAGLKSKLAQKIEKKGDEGHELYGKKIVMTGFRDKDLTAQIESVGGEIAGSVSKNTFVVLVKDKEEDTGKAEQARKLNIPLMTPDEFKTKYL